MCCVLLGCLMALLGGTAAVALTGVAADLHCVTDVPVTVTVVVMSVQLTVVVRLMAVNW